MNSGLSCRAKVGLLVSMKLRYTPLSSRGIQLVTKDFPGQNRSKRLTKYGKAHVLGKCYLQSCFQLLFIMIINSTSCIDLDSSGFYHMLWAGLLSNPVAWIPAVVYQGLQLVSPHLLTSEQRDTSSHAPSDTHEWNIPLGRCTWSQKPWSASCNYLYV